MPSGTPQPFLLSYPGPKTRDGLSLARNGFRFHGLHSEVKAPGLPLRFLHRASPARSVVRSTAGNGLLRFQPLLRLDPLPASRRASPAVAPVSTTLWDFYLPPDQSVLPGKSPVGPPSEFARSPLAPRFRFYR